jgi:DUF4097 and DUF4098 domain-containing protein YvlB
MKHIPAAVLALVVGTALPVLAQDGRTRIDTTYRFNGTGSVELALVSGEIRVTTWDRDEIRVVASTERGTIVPSFSSSRLSLEARSVDRRLGPTRYEVTVPKGVRVRARAVSGDISVAGTRSEMDLSTVSGDIEAVDGTGRVEMESVSGRIAARRMDGRIVASSVSGSIETDEIKGELEAKTVSGRVRVDRASLTSLRSKSVSGSFELSGSLSADGRSTIETHSGTVTLRVPSAFAATVDMETWSGELSSDFAVTLQPGMTQSRRRLDVAVNGGGARLSIKTFSGDIFLRKSDAATRREN